MCYFPPNVEIDRLRAELAAKDARIAELEIAHGQMDGLLSTVRIELAAAKARIADLEAWGDGLRESLGTTISTMEEERARAERAEARIAELEAYHTNCTDYINQLLGNMADDDKERVAILARAECAEEALKAAQEALTNIKTNYGPDTVAGTIARAERAEAQLLAERSTAAYKDVRIERAERAEADLKAAREALKEIEKGYTNATQIARAALNPSPAGREG